MTPAEFLETQAALPPACVQNKISVEDIRRLEAAIAESGSGIDLPVRHYFSPGIYARELSIPAGCVLSGRTHKQINLNILSRGEISVLIDGEIRRIAAPATILSPAGVKRVAYAHTDCVWTTLHGTDLTDIKQIEEEFLEPEPVPAISVSKNPAIHKAAP